jgi:hypothetical protein
VNAFASRKETLLQVQSRSRKRGRAADGHGLSGSHACDCGRHSNISNDLATKMPRVAKAKASQNMANAHRVSGPNGETRVRSPSTESPSEPPKPKYKKGKKPGGKVFAILLVYALPPTRRSSLAESGQAAGSSKSYRISSSYSSLFTPFQYVLPTHPFSPPSVAVSTNTVGSFLSHMSFPQSIMPSLILPSHRTSSWQDHTITRL